MLKEYIVILYGFCIQNFYVITISHLFPSISHLFSHLFQKSFYNIIPLFKCYRNIYGLHRFSIRNSSKLAISHLFSRFHTFFSHLFQLFFYSLRTPHSYPPVKKKIMLIATSVLKFCLGTNFVTPYTLSLIHI